MSSSLGSDPTPAGGRPRRRDRRGRGRRGPDLGAPVPAARTRRERFDELALDVLDDLAARHPRELGTLELAVEECPPLSATWMSTRVPLASLRGPGTAGPARLVLYRRPLEHRAEDRHDLGALVLTVVVEQVADHLGVRPEDLHPDYPDDPEDLPGPR